MIINFLIIVSETFAMAQFDNRFSCPLGPLQEGFSVFDLIDFEHFGVFTVSLVEAKFGFEDVKEIVQFRWRSILVAMKSIFSPRVS